MSRNLRAVKVEWGPCASLFMTPEAFEQLIAGIVGERFKYEYKWNDADEVFKLWVEDGRQFLDRVRDCAVAASVKALDKAVRKDAVLCLNNLKALEPDWRGFVDQHGHLEVWVDGY